VQQLYAALYRHTQHRTHIVPCKALAAPAITEFSIATQAGRLFSCKHISACCC
jgi:hypothetical protein